MPSQPKQPGLSDGAAPGPIPFRRELYREHCQDKHGDLYTVIVYRPFPHLAYTRYELEDGRPVRFVDDCLFQIEATGTMLTRCERGD